MKATGSAASFALRVDGPSDLYSVGHPAPDLVAITKPDTNLATAPGGAGNLTGTFAYRVSFGQKDGALTDPAPVFATIAAADQTVGSGLDDLTSGGTFTGSANAVYTVEIVAEGAPDTVRWRKGTGAWSAPVAITGAAQTIGDGVTGTFGADNGHTAGDSWTITVTIGSETVTDQQVELSGIPLSLDAKCDRRVIARSEDGGATWAICHTIYDNTTETYTDDTVTLDTSKTLPSVNQTGANYGMMALEPDSFDLDPEFSTLPVMALLGTAGKPRGVPGPIKISGSPKSDLRPADLAPFLIAGGGMPDSYAQVAGEPTWIGVWHATTGKRNARTISAFTYHGSENVVPNFLYQLVCEELDISYSGGKITDITPKLTGANYGISPPAVRVAGAGVWTGSFVALGQRYDADALTKSVFIKITQAWVTDGDPVKFRVRVDTASTPDTPATGNFTDAEPEYTLYTSAVSNRQTKGGLQYNDAIELADQDGINLGADSGSNRQPFTLLATAPLTADLAVGDIYEILPTAAIPGVGSAPYSGVPARFAQGPRFTDAHVTIYQGGNVFECTAGTLKFKWPKKEVNALCAGARTVQDLPNEGFFGVDLTIVSYLDSSGARNTIRTDSRAVVQIAIVGERIPINPGTLSSHRESFIVDLPQVGFTSVKSPVTGQVLVVQTIAAEAEQPDAPEADLYTLTLTTRQGWAVPAA